MSEDRGADDAVARGPVKCPEEARALDDDHLTTSKC